MIYNLIFLLLHNINWTFVGQQSSLYFRNEGNLFIDQSFCRNADSRPKEIAQELTRTRNESTSSLISMVIRSVFILFQIETIFYTFFRIVLIPNPLFPLFKILPNLCPSNLSQLRYELCTRSSRFDPLF